jgi:hypothetical protein
VRWIDGNDRAKVVRNVTCDLSRSAAEIEQRIALASELSETPIHGSRILRRTVQITAYDVFVFERLTRPHDDYNG